MRTWWIAAVAALASALSVLAGGFAVGARSLAMAGGASLLCAGLAWFYRARRPEPRIAATLSAVAQVLVVSAAGGIMSYTVAARGGPLWDATFAAWDRALGLDWMAYAAAVDRHGWLARAGGLAYDSFEFQILATLLVLGFTGHLRELERFCTAFALAAVAVVLVSGLMPALGVYPGLGIAPGRFSEITPRDVYTSAAVVTELRHGGLKGFALDDIYGVIAFPSFHTAGGVLVAASLWRVSWARWPALALDAAMIAATPVFGGHYMVDVLAGAAVALAAMAAARRLVGSRRGFRHAPAEPDDGPAAAGLPA
jgi:hypothetical protein